MESDFDATQLDVTQVYVGNTMGVLLAEQVMELDNNSDGLTDLVTQPVKQAGLPRRRRWDNPAPSYRIPVLL